MVLLVVSALCHRDGACDWSSDVCSSDLDRASRRAERGTEYARSNKYHN